MGGGERTSVAIRPGTVDDLAFLEAMLYEAAFHPERPRPPLAEARRLPRLARWVAGWGRRGDLAVVAVGNDGRPVGAAWQRLFDAGELRAVGGLDTVTPVLAIAVRPEWRGRGVGSALLAALMGEARAHGFAALSLTVGRTNPAVRLYERLGFVRCPSPDDGPWGMRAPLAPTADAGAAPSASDCRSDRA